MSRPTPTPAPDQLPPHSPEAEAGVLGCCLLGDAGALGDAMEALPDPLAFFELRHRDLWHAIGGLWRARKPVDIVTVKDALGGPEQLTAAGGLAYIAALPDQVPSAANLPYYLEIVREKFILRRMIQALCSSLEEIRISEESTSEVVAAIERRVMEVGQIAVRPREMSMRQAIHLAQENVLDRFKRGCKMQFGPLTGFNYFDNLVPGLGEGEMIVLASRPSMGKTSLAMHFAENIAANYIARKDGSVAFFSLEMTAQELALRSVFQNAPAQRYKFTNGMLVNAELSHITDACARMAQFPIWIDETADLTVEELYVRARRFKRDHGVKLIVIDYLQLLSSRYQRWANKYEEMAHISKRIKCLSKELRVPILCLAQLNREVERDANRKPRCSDLRDAGQIEQDADVVGLLYEQTIKEKKDDAHAAEHAREIEFLNRVPVPAEWRQPEDWKRYLRRVNVLVAKNRNGMSGVDCPLVFIKRWCKFVDAFTPGLDRELLNLTHGTDPGDHPDEPEEPPHRNGNGGRQQESFDV